MLGTTVGPGDDADAPDDHRLLGIRLTVLLYVVGALAAVALLKAVCRLIRHLTS